MDRLLVTGEQGLLVQTLFVIGGKNTPKIVFAFWMS